MHKNKEVHTFFFNAIIDFLSSHEHRPSLTEKTMVK